MSDAQLDRSAYLAWLAVCLIWGTTYLAIRIALETIPPALVGAIRYAIAGVILIVILRARGARLPDRSSWGTPALVGALMIGLGNGGVIWAEQWVPSGFAALIRMIAMVSSRFTPSFAAEQGRNLNAGHVRRRSAGRVLWTRRGVATFIVLGVLTLPGAARAQEAAVGKFLLGATAGLVLHESGHLVCDVIFDASPGLRGVSFGPLPFFAITHRLVSPAREFVIASAGFWVQNTTDEILLSRPDRNDGYVVKGLLAFNTLASFAYAGAAFARVGPDERDTRGMAESARLAEPWIGGVVLAPAVLDAVRYFKPESRWLRWGSRAAKIGGVLLVLKAHVVAGPSANVIVPLTTTRPSTRANPSS